MSMPGEMALPHASPEPGGGERGAISVNLAALPDDARCHAVIEIPHESDRQALVHPENMRLHFRPRRQGRYAVRGPRGMRG